MKEQIPPIRIIHNPEPFEDRLIYRPDNDLKLHELEEVQEQDDSTCPNLTSDEDITDYDLQLA